MKKEMKKVPAVRFKGFTGDWEQRKFSEFTKNVAVKNKSDLPLEVYAVTNDKGFIAQKEAHGEFGYMNNVDRTVYNIVPPNSFAYNPARINVGSIGYYSGTKNVIVSSLYEVFQTEDSIDDQFLWHWIKSDYFPKWVEKLQEGSVRLYFYYDKLQQVKMMLPSLEEQKKIGCCLEKLDKFLTLHQQKLDQLKKLKAYFLQNLFPAKGEKVPKIRFKGFTGEWERKKLKDCFSDFIVPMRDKPKTFKGNIPWTRIEDIEGKYLNGSLSGRNVSEETIKEMNLKIIPKNSLIVSTSATFGVVAIVTRNLVTNQTFIGLVPNEKDEIKYWYSFFHSDMARNYMRLQSAGSTIFYISRDSFERMPILKPSKQEMIKIGNFFDNLDNLLTCHQQKITQLQAVKKFLLQNLFV
ncbi:MULTISPECIES: restriction endonuclease subunit S [unclassified Acidaminococcus]|uniref:restriction endonuclease subunit S n=1 Tax=unclassified Acidaminococcus TaxID=2635771 RepID=UPI003F93E947